MNSPSRLDPRSGLLPGLPGRPFGQGLPHLKEAGRQRPEALARLDRSQAQQDVVTIRTPHGHGPDHVRRVDIVDVAAGTAYGTLAILPVRNATVRGGAAQAAELDVGSRHTLNLGARPGTEPTGRPQRSLSDAPNLPA